MLDWVKTEPSHDPCCARNDNICFYVAEGLSGWLTRMCFAGDIVFCSEVLMVVLALWAEPHVALTRETARRAGAMTGFVRGRSSFFPHLADGRCTTLRALAL